MDIRKAIKQLDLFPHEIEVVEAELTPKDRAILAAIAKDAAVYPLIRGEHGIKDDSDRLEEMLRYVHGKANCYVEYVAKIGDEMVGYVGVWDGWQAVEMEQTDPVIEMAFVHPKYKHLENNITREFGRICDEVAKNHSEW